MPTRQGLLDGAAQPVSGLTATDRGLRGPREFFNARRSLLLIAGLFVATRAVALIAASASVGSLRRGALTLGGAWDGSWYLGIVAGGYGHTGAQYYATGFYPGWPLLGGAPYQVIAWALQLVHRPLTPAHAHTAIDLSLVLTANACLALGVWALWRLYEPLIGRPAALAGIALLLAAPGSFFFSAGYSESSFLAATALGFLFAHRGRWVAAGAASGAAALIRPQGAALLLPLALLWLTSVRRPILPAVLAAALAVCGVALYPLYTWKLFGDPLLYVTVHGIPGAFGEVTSATSPLETLGFQWQRFVGGVRLLGNDPALAPYVPAPPGNVTTYGLASIVIVIAELQALVGALLSWVTIPRTHFLWAALMVLAPLVTDPHHIALARFALAAWPVYFALGALLQRWRTLLGVALGTSGSAMAVLSYGFTRFLVG